MPCGHADRPFFYPAAPGGTHLALKVLLQANDMLPEREQGEEAAASPTP